LAGKAPGGPCPAICLRGCPGERRLPPGAVPGHGPCPVPRPAHPLGGKAGNPQGANTALLGAACAAGAFPFGMEAMEAAIKKHLPPKIVDVNLVALRLGADALGG